MFTVIIPTHNRHDKLRRAIDYYSSFDTRLIIVDSSTAILGDDLASNIEYHYCPDLNFPEKVLLGCEVCTTDLVLLSPDDDFLLKEPAMEASEYMLKHTDVSLSFGSFIRFEEGDIYSLRSLPRLNICNSKYRSDQSKIKLVTRFMRRYDQVLWSMYRKDVLKNAFDLIQKSKYSNDNFIEVTIAAVAIYRGKLNITNHIWGIRERTIGEHWGARHQLISRSDAMDIKKFINGMSDVSNRKYAEKAIEQYIRYMTVRRLYHVLYRFLEKVSRKTDFSKYIELLTKYD